MATKVDRRRLRSQRFYPETGREVTMHQVFITAWYNQYI